MKYWIVLLIIIITSCSTKQKIGLERVVIQLNPIVEGREFELEFTKGDSYYHPTFAIWTEDMDGNYLETLYATKFVAQGVFGHGQLSPGKWNKEAGPARRPATLPYWSHKRGIIAPDGLYIPSPETAVPDAITSATPQSNFILQSKLSSAVKKFRLLLEINQPWDSNKYWTNSKSPDDIDYSASLQPALVYEAIIDLDSNQKNYELKVIGHSEPSGKNGDLYTDLSTFTTALNIVKNILVRIK